MCGPAHIRMQSTASEVQIARTAAELHAALAAPREAGPVALVPTMGALHEGHLRLLDRARALAQTVVMSVFVNPLQFGPGEDFARYPRDLDSDAALAAGRGADLLFAPTEREIYGDSRGVTIAPGPLAERWEGAIRPGHFAGVLTVVGKLFHLVSPQTAVFGQKDIQQATLVRAMACDLDFPVEVVIAPTVRDADGLALSSRNAYLRPEERAVALVLPRALVALKEAFEQGERAADTLVATARRALDEAPGLRLDYLAVVDPRHLAPVAAAADGSIAMAAARVGATRLLDNVILGVR